MYSSLYIFCYLRKIRCLSKALNLFWLRLVYLKTDTTLHSYRLLETPHRIGKNASIFRTGYFSNWPVFGAKGSLNYGCTDAIWSTDWNYHLSVVYWFLPTACQRLTHQLNMLEPCVWRMFLHLSSTVVGCQMWTVSKYHILVSEHWLPYSNSVWLNGTSPGRQYPISEAKMFSQIQIRLFTVFFSVYF